MQRELIDLREKYKSLQIHAKDLKVQLRLKDSGNSSQQHYSKSKELSPIEIQLKSASAYIKKQIALSDPFPPNVSNDPGFFSQPRPSPDFLYPEVRFRTGRTAYTKGFLANLYHILPKDLHGLVSKHTEFAVLVNYFTPYLRHLLTITSLKGFRRTSGVNWSTKHAKLPPLFSNT